uniref:FAD-binding FR-type domain-containing protein n=1 Tax=Trieres chinensis TaxID=1514140 RepID=A0A7S2A4J8_TRICV|mmetsp:Transcript_39571/g.80731  ORF Transcript_39571/g.80731 Transcript_39571/m.80731 type:complete len:687 (+) Transcript_39571:113-2173(+)
MKRLFVFGTIKVAQILCAIYILVLTFSSSPLGLKDPKSKEIVDIQSSQNTANGFILFNGDYRPIVAEGNYQKLCLAVSRISAFSMYPVMILVFLTKCKAALTFLSKTPFSMYMTDDTHALHIYAGCFIFWGAFIHAIFHVLRWADQGHIALLWEHQTGFTGVVILVVTPLIVVPMICWKEKIRYEIRKGLHYLFYVFAICMCFHGGYIGYVLGFCISLYSLDMMYITLFMTEKIETTTFQVLSSGVLMSMNVSKSFQKRGGQGGFAYVCLPWVDRNQWHAFSLFEHPSNPSKRQVFMLKTGDWTRAVHEALQRNTVRPVWVQGPFVSPYSQAEAYDNQILVASGIGITPALSVIRAHRDSRRSNLIWAVRDPSMLQFFLEHLYLDHDGWNLIFYTGKETLNPALISLNTNVRVINGRPDLRIIIPNIIYGIESLLGLPESYTPREISRVREMVTEKMYDLERCGVMNNFEKLVELTSFASRHGFILTELMRDMEEAKQGAQVQRIPTCFQGMQVPAHDLEGFPGANNLSLVIDFGGDMVHQEETDSTKRVDQWHSNANVSKNNAFEHESDCSSTPSISSLTQEYLGSESSSSSNRTAMSGGDLSELLKAFAKNTEVDSTTYNAPLCSVDPWDDNDQAKDYVKNLDRGSVLSTWGILYCGGNKHIGNDLKRISNQYGISLNQETFTW